MEENRGFGQVSAHRAQTPCSVRLANGPFSTEPRPGGLGGKRKKIPLLHRGMNQMVWRGIPRKEYNHLRYGNCNSPDRN